jgi:hypothetical protein
MEEIEVSPLNTVNIQRRDLVLITIFRGCKDWMEERFGVSSDDY